MREAISFETTRYGFSYYDSLIIASALECECSVLFSEDMQHGQIIESTLKIVNTPSVRSVEIWPP